MKQQDFINRYQEVWQSFEEQLAFAEPMKRSRKQKREMGLTEQSWITFAEHYRQICQHYALAQSRQYSPHLINRLHDLVLRGHQLLYTDNRITLQRILYFIVVDFPRAVRKEASFVWVAALLFYGPLFSTGIAIYAAPELVYSVMAPKQVAEMESMYNPENRALGRERQSDTDIMMFGHYIQNNTSIGFRTFAGGLFYGLGSIFFLFYNGLVIGAVAGHLTHVGFIDTFYPFVVGHGSFELTAIVFSGAVGLKLGWALIRTRRRTRLESLKHAALESLPIVYGMVAMFFIAAFIEAFWSSSTVMPNHVKYTVGGLLWSIVLAYFVLSGRVRGSR